MSILSSAQYTLAILVFITTLLHSSLALAAGSEFRHTAIDWQPVVDRDGYMSIQPAVDLTHVQSEIRQQTQLQNDRQQHYQREMQHREIGSGEIVTAAILPGGFAYLLMRRMGVRALEQRLAFTHATLQELADDQSALQPDSSLAMHADTGSPGSTEARQTALTAILAEIVHVETDTVQGPALIFLQQPIMIASRTAPVQTILVADSTLTVLGSLSVINARRHAQN